VDTRGQDQFAGGGFPSLLGLGRRAADLGGEQSPWKERVSGRWQRRWLTTDSSVEQGLGAEPTTGWRWLRHLATGVAGGAVSPVVGERQEGKGRSDAARLPTRETL
jgi:hypothetical protein